jgi:aminopeptidase-like protein
LITKKTIANKEVELSSEMFNWARELFPIYRSITGKGVRDTLMYLQKICPSLKIKNLPSGKNTFSWTIPEEWEVTSAYIEDESGIKIIDIKNNNLHLISYSVPVDTWLPLEKLDKHLHSLPDQPTAIPYLTSYYSKNWGFCLSHNQRSKLKNGNYHVVIESKFKKGNLSYGEILIPGKEKKEIFLSTYICHPSLANNEISGPVVTIALARFLNSIKNRRFSYRIVFVPETIGAIAYIHKNLKILKQKIIAGFVLTCVGDNKCFSFLASRKNNTFADKVARFALEDSELKFKEYSFLDRGSDERQYCSPKVDLPVCSIMRSKYMEYPEYHTSLDNLEFISPEGLVGSFKIYQKIIFIIENNYKYINTFACEPYLVKFGLGTKLGSLKDKSLTTTNILNILAYADGENDLIDISRITLIKVEDCIAIIDKLINLKLLKRKKLKNQ